MTFTKLFSSITESTVWCEDSDTRVVWITMLAMANKNGFVFASEPGLASRAKVSLPAVISALQKFLSPDKYSRSKEFEGRRIEHVDGGWRLLNYLKHRAIRDEEERREYLKLYMRDRRRKQSALTNVNNVNHGEPPLTHTEAEADKQKKNNSKSLAQLALSEAEIIYQMYPRKIGKRSALKAILTAIDRVEKGEYKNGPLDFSRAVAGIKHRTSMFADSKAGKRGQFTPHPATWFNRSSYLEDPKEWDAEEIAEKKQTVAERNNRAFEEMAKRSQQNLPGVLENS